MATQTLNPLLSLEDYFHSSPQPDVEFIDGRTEPKPMTGFIHGNVQLLLGQWFLDHASEWRIRVSAETRTQVSLSRVRLPDIVVTDRHLPYDPGALTSPPLLAIEVLSPHDTFQELNDRARDLWAMGVRAIWLIDPSRREHYVWDGDQTWVRRPEEMLHATDTIYLSFEWLWSKLDQSMQ